MYRLGLFRFQVDGPKIKHMGQITNRIYMYCTRVAHVRKQKSQCRRRNDAL